VRRERGFSLIELLVALAVFALIGALVASAVRAGLGGARRMDAHAERLEEVRLSQTFLRRQLGLAQPVFWRDDERRSLAFEGAPDHVDFVAEAAPQLGGGARVFRVARTADGVELLWAPLAADAASFAFERAQRRLLVGRLGAVRFSYFGAVESNRPPTWREDWRGPALPLLVRIAAAADDWPELTIGPMLTPAFR
jgi:general secretion pathway protein J